MYLQNAKIRKNPETANKKVPLVALFCLLYSLPLGRQRLSTVRVTKPLAVCATRT